MDLNVLLQAYLQLLLVIYFRPKDVARTGTHSKENACPDSILDLILRMLIYLFLDQSNTKPREEVS
jgi:hypothetical protein